MYLSSFDIGNQPSELVALAPKGRVAIIMNALDDHPAEREKWRAAQSNKLAALGFSVTEVDLRKFFDASAHLRDVLEDIDLVWINGGNAFILRRAMKMSGFDILIKKALAKDQIAYAGFSAAAVIVSDSLRGLEAVDDPTDVPSGYPSEIVWEGLGLLPFALVVHFKSAHSESALVEREVEFYEREGIPYRTLRDGEALIINGTEEKIVGF